MKNYTQIQAGLMDFIDEEIIAKAMPLQKFMMGTAVGLAMPKFESIYTQLVNNPMAKTLDLVDEDGMIDIDAVYIAAKDAIKKSGSVNVYGVLLNEKDLDKLYTLINNK